MGCEGSERPLMGCEGSEKGGRTYIWTYIRMDVRTYGKSPYVFYKGIIQKDMGQKRVWD
jgi:hypothetical protein